MVYILFIIGPHSLFVNSKTYMVNNPPADQEERTPHGCMKIAPFHILFGMVR